MVQLVTLNRHFLPSCDNMTPYQHSVLSLLLYHSTLSLYSVALHHYSIPSRCPSTVLYPTLYPITVSHHTVPVLCTTTPYHHSILSLSSVTLFRHRIPSLCTITLTVTFVLPLTEPPRPFHRPKTHTPATLQSRD